MRLGAAPPLLSRTARGTRTDRWRAHFRDAAKCGWSILPMSRNEFANSVLAVPITTNLRVAPTHLLLPAGQAGLSFDSVARCENVSYLPKSRLRRGAFSGTVSADLMGEIERCLLRSFGIGA
jgi:mRNA-degrading endonuclease toxin of MazEF toxin-antitoxin module